MAPLIPWTGHRRRWTRRSCTTTRASEQAACAPRADLVRLSWFRRPSSPHRVNANCGTIASRQNGESRPSKRTPLLCTGALENIVGVLDMRAPRSILCRTRSAAGRAGRRDGDACAGGWGDRPAQTRLRSARVPARGTRGGGGSETRPRRSVPRSERVACKRMVLSPCSGSSWGCGAARQA